MMQHCGRTIDPIIKPKGPHLGAYCPICGELITKIYQESVGILRGSTEQLHELWDKIDDCPF